MIFSCFSWQASPECSIKQLTDSQSAYSYCQAVTIEQLFQHWIPRGKKVARTALQDDVGAYVSAIGENAISQLCPGNVCVCATFYLYYSVVGLQDVGLAPQTKCWEGASSQRSDWRTFVPATSREKEGICYLSFKGPLKRNGTLSAL